MFLPLLQLFPVEVNVVIIGAGETRYFDDFFSQQRVDECGAVETADAETVVAVTGVEPLAAAPRGKNGSDCGSPTIDEEVSKASV